MKSLIIIISICLSSFLGNSQCDELTELNLGQSTIYGFNIQSPRSMVTDNDGNIYIAGGGFIAKIDASGNFIWEQQLSIGSQTINIDNLGNIYVAGTFQNTQDFDYSWNNEALTSIGLYDAFILKLENDGTFQWVKGLHGGGDQSIEKIEIDQYDHIYIHVKCGYYPIPFTDPAVVDFDPDISNEYNIEIPGGYSHYILCLDQNGTFKWTHEFPRIIDIEIDLAGGINLTGTYSSSFDFDPSNNVEIPLETNGAYILDLSSIGDLNWFKRFGDINGLPNPIDLKIDNNGDLLFTARYFVDTDVDPGTSQFILEYEILNSNNNENQFILKLDSNGDFLWSYPVFFGDKGFMAITNNSNNEIILIGSFINTIDFDLSQGVYEVENTKNYDQGFILKMNADGSFKCVGILDEDIDASSWRLEIDLLENDSILVRNDKQFYKMGATTNTFINEEVFVNKQINLFPNPSNTGLIQLNTSIANSDINVYSIEGKQINFTQSNNVIDISDNEKGVYLISIDGVVTRYVYQD